MSSQGQYLVESDKSHTNPTRKSFTNSKFFMIITVIISIFVWLLLIINIFFFRNVAKDPTLLASKHDSDKTLVNHSTNMMYMNVVLLVMFTPIVVGVIYTLMSSVNTKQKHRDVYNSYADKTNEYLYDQSNSWANTQKDGYDNRISAIRRKQPQPEAQRPQAQRPQAQRPQAQRPQAQRPQAQRPQAQQIRPPTRKYSTTQETRM
jgi:biopolymer transport protein ExbB/TolQ